MPQTGNQQPFDGQSLKGMELDVKLLSANTRTWSNLFAATAFDVQVAAASTSRQHTLNAGSRTSTGAAGEITATCDVFVVPDSPGQWLINNAFSSGAKVQIRRSLFGSQIATETLAATKTIEIAAATGTATGKGVPKAGGAITFSGVDDFESRARAGMTLKIGTNYYFIGYEATADDGTMTLYADPSPDDGASSSATSLITGFPYIGAAVAAVNSGSAVLYNGRVRVTTYTGTVTVPVVPTDAAPGDDGNDLSTAQISFALDDIGTESTPTDPVA